MKNTDNTLYLLYRRGDSEHIKSLYEKGEVYINTVENIRKYDDNKERSDPDDGIKKRIFLGDTEITFCEDGEDIEKFGTTVDCKDTVIKFDSKEKGNIYCFSGIFTKHITGKSENIKIDTKSFGESLIVIHNPKEFVNRIIKGLKNNGYDNIKYKPIEYYHHEYSGQLGVFKKHEIFKPQNEFRVFVPNEKNKIIKIYIGTIKDISSIEKNNQITITYNDKKKQTIEI
ncbi:hypothetical protein LV84_04262 [Algoriphagus ratkowskyi]|uniref:Uncharacterized protein n=1 Tax=Algoriphagus ratkowskyi TaxID=57028 RepID=A0A2W7R5F8_9BACT|nr:hypothetical protein [Algoriphagus ratkowskyi]PZX49319.1 hypothetical protein LV84_04262 [Algoriphagus ratkowskyi]TXD75389.1 hypothetical protein ESW18_20710 [Algoriphagus ratkowskyi]